MLLNELTQSQWLWLVFAALCIGVSKSGFSGISLIAVSIFADLFGKAGVGVMLPILIVSDLVSYKMYAKLGGSWKQALPLIIPSLLGIAGGYLCLKMMNDNQAKLMVAGIIAIMVIFQIFKTIKPQQLERFFKRRTFNFIAGFGGGVATTIANAAGPVIKLYLVAKSFPKLELMGISVRFFLLINLLKLPLNAQLNFMSSETVLIDLILSPIMIAGLFFGKKLLMICNQSLFDKLVVLFALIAIVRLVLSVYIT